MRNVICVGLLQTGGREELGGAMVVWVGFHKGGKTSLVAPDGNVNAFM